MTQQTYERVAVIVPCHNEEATVATVVTDFRAALPGCTVVVADNASTDATARAASEAGAHVIPEPRPGKGNAVRRLFADVDADCYLMVDGDATYDASAAPTLVADVLGHGIDMVVGSRIAGKEVADAYRNGHRLGNAVLTWIFQRLFELRVEDTLSGYRAFSRRFVKTFPSMASGFEIEAELNAHAASMGANYSEHPTAYGARPEGSESKLSTYSDGLRILRRNVRLFRDWRPSLAFAIQSVPFFIVAIVLLWPVLHEYAHSRTVPRFPSLIVGVSAGEIGLLMLLIGAILQRVTRNRVEAVRTAYLAIPGPGLHPAGGAHGLVETVPAQIGALSVGFSARNADT